MLSWAIPLRNKNLTENSKLLGLANSFAGGIFLMLAFGHMLPHSVGVLESIGADRNIAFKFTLVGYLLVFFIEKIAFNSHALLHDAMDNGSDTAHTHTHNTHNAVKEVTNIMSENVQYGQSVLTASLDTATVSLGQGPGPSFQNMNENFNQNKEQNQIPSSSSSSSSSSSATIIEGGEVISFKLLVVVLFTFTIIFY